MSMIEADGRRYRVVETLPPVQAGCPAKVVRTGAGERVAVRASGTWRWWTAQDRLAPRGPVSGQEVSR